MGIAPRMTPVIKTSKDYVLIELHFYDNHDTHDIQTRIIHHDQFCMQLPICSNACCLP